MESDVSLPRAAPQVAHRVGRPAIVPRSFTDAFREEIDPSVIIVTKHAVQREAAALSMAVRNKLARTQAPSGGSLGPIADVLSASAVQRWRGVRLDSAMPDVAFSR